MEKIGRVRLIGVDTPETVDPRKPVQYYGKEASNFLKSFLNGKSVRLEYDQNTKDRYERTLAYLFLEDGTFVNLKIVEDGFGFAYTKYPFQRMELFRSAERSARENKRGLWAEKLVAVAKIKKGKSSSKSQSSCEIRKTCPKMKNCDEAMFYFKTCGLKRLDGNKDGVPCEKLCR